MEKYRQIKIGIGSEAFEELLKEVNLVEELEKVKNNLKSSSKVHHEKIKFLRSLLDQELKLEWIIMRYLPVIPSGLRPVTKLKEENTIATTQKNNLLQRVILAKKRINEYQKESEGSPSFQNKVKGLLQELSGKDGIMRRHSLGKRVDYSARSVIVPNPNLLLTQIGLPVRMALILYRPFIIQKILKKKIVSTVKEAEKIWLNKGPVVFSLLDKIIQEHPVLANRAPSLHRLSIQGFYPKLTTGNSIELNPLITTPLNADFDGDQIAIHLPLTKKACEEIKERILSSHHLIDPKNGFLIDAPSQDMILGIYYLSKENKQENPIFFDEIAEIASKKEQIQQSEKKIKQIDEHYLQGYYSEEESKQKKIAVWEEYSGARASSENLTQLFAMRGHTTNYLGEIIETPIISSLREGLSPFEFFTSVYGAIKGMTDIALKTAAAGDLTRRLVESSQGLTIIASDCQTSAGKLLKETSELSLVERIYGRYLAQDILDKKTPLLVRNTLLLEKEIEIIQKSKINSAWVRSPATCELADGICQKCYGLDLSKLGETVAIGTAVGIIAAQSLGEPGTQLTMRTFHVGGIAGEEEDITQGLPKVKQVLDNIKPKKEEKAILAKIDGKIISIEEKEIKQVGEETKVYQISEEKIVKVNEGDEVKKGEKITTGKVDLEDYLEIMGRDACQDYIKEEIRNVYSSQGIDINEKHIEIFTRQMLSKVEVIDNGDSDYLIGDIVNYQHLQKVNQSLTASKKKPVAFKNIVLSLKDLASHPDSFLAGISFQNTLKSLVNYSLYQPVDYLRGSKESLIAGQLIPVGTGLVEREKYSKKRLGQNFLFDKNYLHKIVDCCSIDTNSVIIEVGSGYGNLTNLLAETDCQKIIGVEKDSNLFQWLVKNNKSERIIYLKQDALTID
ncbi:10709_t:CDS:2 [Funneliformis geosporum]|uniref:DNA-directed RNA polymerase n=1 Tax=Funneliformis geosporum TaxID=1117311 RepID=A0A9W4SBL8_9GLOM|nr:10709_t:CDS:2 [Funneliformis geosporum]